MRQTKRALREGPFRRSSIGWPDLRLPKMDRPVFEEAFGEVRPSESMTTGHLLPWMSSSKPVAAVAIAQLSERGLLALDDRVADHIQEFGNPRQREHHDSTSLDPHGGHPNAGCRLAQGDLGGDHCQDLPRPARAPLGAWSDRRLPPDVELVHPGRDRPPSGWSVLRPICPAGGLRASRDARLLDRNARRDLHPECRAPGTSLRHAAGGARRAQLELRETGDPLLTRCQRLGTGPGAGAFLRDALDGWHLAGVCRFSCPRPWRP